MEFGMFHEFQCRPGLSNAEVFDEGFGLVDDAERLGLDVMWLAELHLTPVRSVLASPMTIATAIAARTQRIKVGTAVQVLPLCHPLRLAEEVATVDQISRGRLIFGVGRSGFARTYEAYGIPYAESRERFAETLDILRKAWTEPTFSHEGKHYRFNNISLMPRPYLSASGGYPPIRVAANTADTFPTLGRQGFPIFAAVRLGTFSDLLPNVKAYQKAWREAGHPGRGQVYIRVPIYLAETAAEAQAEPEESMMSFYRNFAVQLEINAARVDPGSAERAEIAAQIARLTYQDILREKVVVGTPEQVVERLTELREELGLDGILAELTTGGKLQPEQVRRSLRLLCEQVMPAFK
jgi:alkanesulfonate monooxygenase SsuD/methylene tetrahydromethanopterin reductase-like flavin-dependent oxidoreductase (luciferase family)